MKFVAIQAFRTIPMGQSFNAFSFGDIAASTALWAVVLSKDVDELRNSDSPSKMTILMFEI